MILDYTISQNDHNGLLQSDLIITVDYSVADRKVEAITRIRTYSHQHRNYTDITVLMYNEFFDQLVSMINQVNWWELARLKMKPKITPAI